MSAPRELLGALEEAARLLEGGDAPAASTALSRAADCCRSFAAAGALLDAQSLETFRLLQGRCEGAAHRAQASLKSALEQAGAGRRASAAYRRRQS